ncbi:MAG: hypothetical protein LH615_05065 [Ferruginibacter sp.]|nr:hypothetical protein [Ferruginibacter sp.]
MLTFTSISLFNEGFGWDEQSISATQQNPAVSRIHVVNPITLNLTVDIVKNA